MRGAVDFRHRVSGLVQRNVDTEIGVYPAPIKSRIQLYFKSKSLFIFDYPAK